MSVISIHDMDDPGDVHDDELVQYAEQLLQHAKTLAQLKKNQKILLSNQQQLSCKVDQALEAIDRRDKFLQIIPEIEKMGVKIPKGMEAQVGKECKRIAISLGDDPVARLKEGIGQYAVITYPRELVGPIARRWFELHRNNLSRVNWFKHLWKIKAPLIGGQSYRAESDKDFVSKVKEANDLIVQLLRNGPRESDTILDIMDKKKIPNQVWMTAKTQLGIVVKRCGQSLVWSFPEK